MRCTRPPPPSTGKISSCLRPAPLLTVAAWGHPGRMRRIARRVVHRRSWERSDAVFWARTGNPGRRGDDRHAGGGRVRVRRRHRGGQDGPRQGDRPTTRHRGRRGESERTDVAPVGCLRLRRRADGVAEQRPRRGSVPGTRLAGTPAGGGDQPHSPPRSGRAPRTGHRRLGRDGRREPQHPGVRVRSAPRYRGQRDRDRAHAGGAPRFRRGDPHPHRTALLRRVGRARSRDDRRGHQPGGDAHRGRIDGR